MTTKRYPFDVELLRADNGRWVWEIYPDDGTPLLLAHGRSRFRLLAYAKIRRQLRNLRHPLVDPTLAHTKESA